MSNPFDQFDAPSSKGNPFDQFDEGDTPKKKAGFSTAVKKSLASAGNAIESAISLPAGALATYAGFPEQGDEIFRKMDANRAARDKWANPDNLETSLGQDIGATIATLPTQIPAMVGQAAEKGMDLIKRGEPLSRAVPATVADAALNAVGMGPMAPAKTFARRAAIGAAANVATGAGSDALTQLLATQEETKKAYNPYDARRRALDAAVGGITQGVMGERPAKKVSKVDSVRAAQKQKAPEAKAPEAPVVPEQMRLFDQFDERSPISPYQTEMAPDMWRVDENGIPIRADLSMEAQNLQQPLQRNLFGDELDANFPRDPNKPLDMATGDIPGVERFSDPVQFRNDPEGQIPLTEAIDNMPEGIRNRENGKFASGTTRQSALNLLRGELFPDDAMRTAVQEADMQQWLRENAVDNKKPAPLGSKARKEQVRKMGWAKKQGGGVMMDPFGRVPDSSDKLQDLLKSVPYRFQTLEGLPNKEKVTFEQIKQVVNREGVSAAEKSLIQEAYAIALFTSDRDFVTARELVDGLQDAIQDLTLKPAKTAEYADYGLASIGRDAGTKWEPIPRAEWTPYQVLEYQEYNIFPERKVNTPGGIEPTTNMWESSDALSAGVRNHFDNENYVGHTRSFVENGVRHVVEIQSDLLQNYKEGNPKYRDMSDTEVKALAEKYVDDLEYVKERLAEIDASGYGPENPQRANWDDRRIDMLKLVDEIQQEVFNRTKAAQGFSSPAKMMQKNWVVRLIREELGDAAKKGETSVRFASADTMAKVEQWPNLLDEWRNELKRVVAEKKSLEELIERRSGLEGGEEALAELDAEIKRLGEKYLEQQKSGKMFDPRLQGIYDRYQKEVTKYLTSIGGKPMVDDKGHSWIEVPVEKHRQRPIMFGQKGGLLIDWSDQTKMDNATALGDDTIPKNPDIEEVLAKAKAEGKDGNLQINIPFTKKKIMGTTYVQSGATSAAMKTGSAAIKAASEIVQNALKRSEWNNRQWVFPAEGALRKLSRQEMTDVATLMKDEMFSGQRYDGDILAENLTVKQLEAYTNMRNLFDKTMDAQNAARVAKGQKPITPQEAYLSSRWQGDFRRPVMDSEGKVVWYLAAKTKLGLEAETKSLLKMFPDLVIDKAKDHVVKSGQSTTDLQSMYSTMLDLLGRDDPAITKIKEAIEAQTIAEGGRTLAQEKHFQKKGNVRGFIGDRPWKNPGKEAVEMFQQQIQYAKNAFRWSEMQKAADDIKAIVSDKDLQQQQPNNVKYIREYFKNAIGMGEANVTRALNDSLRQGLGVSPQVIDSAVGGVKSFFITQKLIASAGYTAANLIQTSNVLPYLMNLRGQGYKGNPATAVLVGVPAGIMMTASHYMKSIGGEYLNKLPDQFLKDAILYAEQNGVTARSVYDESPLESSLSRVKTAVGMVGKATMSAPETLVRSVAFMTYAQMLKDSGKFSDKIALFQKAEELVNASMVDYRETERPLMFSKMGSAGNFLNTLQTYPMSFYNQYSYMLGEFVKGRPTGLMAMMALQYALAGAMGLPGFDDTDKLYKWIRDNVLPTDTWAKAMKSKFWSDPKLWLMETAGDSAVYGALSDTSGIGMTSRVSAPGAGAMLQSPAGPVLDIAKQIGSVGSAVASVDDGTKWAQAAMNVSPVGLQGLLETAPFMKGYTHEVDPETGRTVFFKTSDLADRKGAYERSPEEIAVRQWGVRSQKEVKTRDVAYATSSANLALEKRSGELIDRIYSAARTGNTKRVQELSALYTELTGKAITETQIANQIKEEMYTDVQRNQMNANTPQQLLNVGRMNKLLESK